MEHNLKRIQEFYKIMKRENIKLANELDTAIIKIENQIEIWRKSNSLYGLCGKIKIKEMEVVGTSYEVCLSDIPFDKLRKLFLEHHQEQKKIKEKQLQQILIDG